MSKDASKLSSRLIVDLDKCTGCMACTLACSFTKFGVFSPEYSSIRVLKFEKAGVDCPLFCQQCEDARCISACPKGAIFPDPETGIIVIGETCDGCGICMVSCPYGAIAVHPESLKGSRLMLKCDLCGGNPQCLQWCETGALQYVNAEQTELIKEARENLIMAKKRFEIEHQTPLWKYYSRKSRVASPANEGA